MWKHVIISSIQSAFVAALMLVIISLPTFGGVATVFGFIAFPIAIFWCFILAYPLILLRQHYKFSEQINFAIYTSVGCVFGVLTPVFIFGVSGPEFSQKTVVFFGSYGLLGSLCAITAWNYVRKNVSL
jgi:hypothetical protein